jgi:hypothetical protein
MWLLGDDISTTLLVGNSFILSGCPPTYCRGVGTCPVCNDEVANLAEHLIALANESDGRHIMWLNRNVTKKAVGAEQLARLLAGEATSTERIRR